MSTRRARIKAVAALPPRRKNADTVDGSKNKQLPSKETAEKALISPKTPRPLASTPEEKNSPAVKTLRPTPQLIPISRKTPICPENVLSSIIIPATAKLTPGVSEKVPVITSASSNKSISNFFASPPAKNLPDLKIASPLVPPSPRPAKSIQKSALESLKADFLGEIGNNEPIDRKTNEAIVKTPSVEKKNDIPDGK